MAGIGSFRRIKTMSKSVLAIHPLRSSTKMQEKNTCVELKYTNSTMSAHNSNEKKRANKRFNDRNERRNVIYSCLRCSIIIVFMCHRSFPFSCNSNNNMRTFFSCCVLFFRCVPFCCCRCHRRRRRLRSR